MIVHEQRRYNTRVPVFAFGILSPLWLFCRLWPGVPTGVFVPVPTPPTPEPPPVKLRAAANTDDTGNAMTGRFCVLPAIEVEEPDAFNGVEYPVVAVPVVDVGVGGLLLPLLPESRPAPSNERIAVSSTATVGR